MPQRQKTVVQDHGPLLAGLPVWVDEVSSFLFGLSEVLKTARRIRTLGEHGDHIELSAAEAERISRDLDDLMVTGTDLRKHLGKAA